MLEIPESIVIAKQIEENLKGKCISYVEANHSPHKFAWYEGNPADYDELLSGKCITGAVARGGMLEVQVEDCCIVFSDGASPKYYTDLKNVPKKHQLYIEFDDQTAIAATVAMYGGMLAFPQGKIEDEYYTGAVEKISPLSTKFDFSYFKALWNKECDKKSVKAFLATEQRIPGLGNGVLQDILYQAQLFPKRKMETLSDTEFENLYKSIKSVLSQMVEEGGRNTEKDLFGNPGGYLTYLSKYTLHTPCPKCGCEIHKEAYMGGTIYYCERCQK